MRNASSQAAAAEPASQLRRELGLADAVAIGLGAVIGAGIFVVTGVAASVAGASLIAGLAVAGVAAACNALSSAELAAAYPLSGGTYEYGYRVLHPWAGFAAGWMFVASKLAGGGTVAIGFGAYLNALVPAVEPRVAAVVAVAGLAAANYFGVRKAGRLNTAIVAVTVGALLYFVAAGAPAVASANFEPFAPAGWRGVLNAAALLFFAYTGYARIATLGEEVRDPARTIPRAVVITVAASIVLYLAVATVAVGTVGADVLAASASPLESAAGALRAPGVAGVVGVGATTAMLGVLLSQVLGISRMLFAMARRGDLPAAFERVHATHAVPHVGIAFTAVVIATLALVGTLEVVVAAAAFTILLYYAITNVAALRLAPAHHRFPRWVPALGLVSCLALAASLDLPTVASGLGLLAAGFVVRGLLRRAPPTERHES